MTNITPESLRKVAEYMGYKTPDISGSDVILNCEWKANGERVTYNPLQNSDQCLELMEKLRKVTSLEIKLTLDCDVLISYDFHIYYQGKTINEAVTLAAIAYVEGLDNDIGK